MPDFQQSNSEPITGKYIGLIQNFDTANGRSHGGMVSVDMV